MVRPVTDSQGAVVSRLATLTREWPEAEVMQFGPERWTWGAVGLLADRLAVLLDERGVDPDAPIALVLRQRPAMVAAELATLAQGRGALLVSPLVGDHSLAVELTSIPTSVAVLHELDWQRDGVRQAVESAGLVGLVVDDAGSITVAVAPPAARRPGPFGGAVTVLTSGTTGPPKRLVVPWERFVELGGGPNGRTPRSGTGALILSLPLVTLGGLLSMSRLVFGGRPMAFMERFDVHQWAALVKTHRPQVMGAPPPVVSMILAAGIDPEHFDGVTAFITSSAAVPVEVSRAFEHRYGIPVLVGYGATEFLGAVTGWTVDLWRRCGAAKAGSVGIAMPGAGVRVVDPGAGHVLDTDEIGVIEVDPPRRAGGMSPGWLRTSDRGHFDADGFLWIDGRADEVIVRGGFKVDARAVMAVLKSHPSVEDACVVGLPDERLGQVPGALVVLGTQAPATAEELREWVGRHMAAFCRPAVIRFADSIPLTATFKPHLAEVASRLSWPDSGS